MNIINKTAYIISLRIGNIIEDQFLSFLEDNAISMRGYFIGTNFCRFTSYFKSVLRRNLK